MDRSSKKYSIKEWNKDDRPREKLLTKGKKSLSNAELIAILLGSGSRDANALDLAKSILQTTNNSLSDFSRLEVRDFMRFKGVGPAKAVRLITAFELARRYQLEKWPVSRIINSSRSAFQLLQPEFDGLKHEEFWVLYLNAANKMIEKVQLSKGGLTATLVDRRLIFNKALEVLATGIILCHNHPSGSLTPSRADRNLTKQLIQAGRALDIKIIDHLIISEKEYFSFADRNLL